jgi:hypothetical protein
MEKRTIYLGNSEIDHRDERVEGAFVEIGDERYYKISNTHEMPDFFISIISDSDLWMFISSNGSLSAGRKDRDHALFPYYTVDKIHDYREKTGSRTWALVTRGGKTSLWEPFTGTSKMAYRISRNLYKNMVGNRIIFEELNHDLEVSFQYSWSNCDTFGFVKESQISNQSDAPVDVEILDGIRNILPYGVDYAFQNEYSNLLDAYKKSELVEKSTLGLFLLSAIPVDRAEPSEALKSTTVWSAGLERGSKILLSDKQVGHFAKGLEIKEESDIRASRGSYHIHSFLGLGANSSKQWMLVADVNQDSSDVANLHQLIGSEKDLTGMVHKEMARGTMHLKQIVAKADGFQKGNEPLSCVRHYSNTLYNIMRGGVFIDNYTIQTDDLKRFVRQTNREVYANDQTWLNELPEMIQLQDLIQRAKETGHQDLERICLEYFPLTFSRRHGDPSRPWNLFSIETRNPDGSTRLHFEGNWRDIFQNWEALSLSFPGYTEGMVHKFLNASTADGYNPYRITRDGVDWEAPDPNDPWAYIGYWGDHQIIYLLKFLELAKSYDPGKLEELMTREVFVYVNVPYRIKKFEQMVSNPKDTIEFDHRLHQEILNRAERKGSDGCLLHNGQGVLCRANMAEKILVTLLSKLSNFIPGAGIWLNTQRPEWNDANNAIVGNGTSMVTLYYLRRFVRFWQLLLTSPGVEEISISAEIHGLLEKVYSLFIQSAALLEKGFSDSDRWNFAEYLGTAGSDYRETIYSNALSGEKLMVQVDTLRAFAEITLRYIDQSIRVNRRKDGLFHAYNLVSMDGKCISVRHLYEMLEGQVAVLSSGYLTVDESLDVLNALKVSSMFRADQNSYMLYPDRQLPRFTEKNRIPPSRVKDSELLRTLSAGNDTSVIAADKNGHFHFSGEIRNAFVLAGKLENLRAGPYKPLVDKEKELVLDIYEEVFDHQSFTGRSGTFFGYEGLGSIYWHMVSKLLLATGECYFDGLKGGADAQVLHQIKAHYDEIKAGIGLYKSPLKYGAFPTDAYSHTPSGSGVKQPGLTGQVKEDFISRMKELGVHVKNGEITFNVSLLNREELLEEQGSFEYVDLEGKVCHILLDGGQLGFTCCQVPVIYRKDEKEQLLIEFSNGEQTVRPGNVISSEISSHLFLRDGTVKRIDYSSPGLLCPEHMI